MVEEANPGVVNDLRSH